jgi:hypothetical protein
MAELVVRAPAPGLARRSRAATRARTRAAKACHSAPPRVAASSAGSRPSSPTSARASRRRSIRSRANVPTGRRRSGHRDAGQGPHREPANFSVSVLGASGGAAFAASLLHDPLPRPAGPRLRSPASSMSMRAGSGDRTRRTSTRERSSSHRALGWQSSAHPAPGGVAWTAGVVVLRARMRREQVKPPCDTVSISFFTGSRFGYRDQTSDPDGGP